MMHEGQATRMLRAWWRAARWIASCLLLKLAQKTAPRDVDYSLIIIVAAELGVSEAWRECGRLKHMLDVTERW